MSLIDEALKRARMEAAQRAAEQEGLPYPAIPRHQPVRRRVLPVAGAVALAAAIGIAAGLWLAGRQRPAVPVAAQPPGPVAAPVEPPPPPTPVATPAGPEPAPPEAAATTRQGSAAALPADRRASAAGAADSPRHAPARAAPAAAAPPPATPPVTSAQAPPSGPTPAAEVISPPPVAAAAVPAAAPISDPDSGVLLVLPEGEAAAAPGASGEGAPADESYRQQYELPDGGTIELGGIAWSETGPFALINGRVVGPGSAVEEFTLERIGPEHVILSAGERRIRIDLR